jgi:hypothetical protein
VTPQPSELLLRESTRGTILMRDGSGSMRLVETPEEAAGDGVFNDDGTFNAVLLRPCVGRGPAGVGNGPGRRIYTPQLLESLARDGVFHGWASYMNHESPLARKTRMGLPRPPSELANEIVETSFLSGFTTADDAKYGYQPGALAARLKPATGLVEDLVRRVPRLIRFSLNAQATDMRRGRAPWGGDEGWLVEGVENDPENSSVDMVTTAGAGGVVRSLLESHYAEGHEADDELLDGVSDERLVAYLRTKRPTLDLTESAGDDDDMGKTLAEILAGPEVTAHIKSLVEATIEERDLVPRDEAERLGREASARENMQRALARRAKVLIEAAKLPPTSTADLLERYGVEDADNGTLKVGGSLALIEAVTDGDGKVEKTSTKVLEDELDRVLKVERKKLSEAAPTVPYSPPAGGGGGDGNTATASFGGDGSQWGQYAREKGIDPSLFGGVTAPAKTATQ